MLIRLDLALYDLHPCEGIDAVDEDPDAYDGDEPVAGMAEMIPQLDETDIEGEHHHHYGNDTDEEKQVVEAFLCHSLSAMRRQNPS